MFYTKTKMYEVPALSDDILDECTGVVGKNKIFTIGLKMWFKTRL